MVETPIKDTQEDTLDGKTTKIQLVPGNVEVTKVRLMADISSSLLRIAEVLEKMYKKIEEEK